MYATPRSGEGDGRLPRGRLVFNDHGEDQELAPRRFLAEVERLELLACARACPLPLRIREIVNLLFAASLPAGAGNGLGDALLAASRGRRPAWRSRRYHSRRFLPRRSIAPRLQNGQARTGSATIPIAATKARVKASLRYMAENPVGEKRGVRSQKSEVRRATGANPILFRVLPCIPWTKNKSHQVQGVLSGWRFPPGATLPAPDLVFFSRFFACFAVSLFQSLGVSATRRFKPYLTTASCSARG